MELDKRQLDTAFATARTSLEFDAQARTYAGHRTMTSGHRTIRLVPLRAATTPIGILARSLALSLNEKGKLTAAGETTLRALQDALAKRGFVGTR